MIFNLVIMSSALDSVVTATYLRQFFIFSNFQDIFCILSRYYIITLTQKRHVWSATIPDEEGFLCVEIRTFFVQYFFSGQVRKMPQVFCFPNNLWVFLVQMHITLRKSHWKNLLLQANFKDFFKCDKILNPYAVGI